MRERELKRVRVKTDIMSLTDSRNMQWMYNVYEIVGVVGNSELRGSEYDDWDDIRMYDVG